MWIIWSDYESEYDMNKQLRIWYEQAADDFGGLFIVQHLVVIFAVVRGKGVSFDFSEFSVDVQSFLKEK